MLDAVSRAGRTSRPQQPERAPASPQAPGGVETPTPELALPDPRDPVAAVERESLKAVLQVPALAGAFDALASTCLVAPAYAAVARCRGRRRWRGRGGHRNGRCGGGLGRKSSYGDQQPGCRAAW